MMNKRGQVTVFVIVGIVIVVSIFLVFYFLGDKIQRDTDVQVVFDESSLEPLQNYVEECIEKHGDEAIDLVLKQGGKIDPGFYHYFNDDKLNYLCYSDDLSSCERKVPFISKMFEDEIKNYLDSKLSSCINLDEIRNEGFNVQEGKIVVDVDVFDYSVAVNLNYPITVTKGVSVINENEFSKTFDVPLGRMAKISKDIVDSEVSYGEFFNQIYEVKHPEVTVKSYGPVNVEVYTVSLRDYDYNFQFAIRSWA